MFDQQSQLVDEGLVEKKRGRGMFINDGAHKQLLIDERQHFIEKEWPTILERIGRLGLDKAELLKTSKSSKNKEKDTGDDNE